MGIPPSGGFTAKWLLLQAALDSGQWWWALVIVAGGLLTGGYVFRVLSAAMQARAAPIFPVAPVDLAQERVALGLAVISVLLGLLPLGAFGLMQIGR
jgi:NADH:ubiquinone oxidoreductase subunit 2 (subunit N)